MNVSWLGTAEAAEMVVGREINYISSSEVSEVNEDDFPLPRSDSDDGFSPHSASLTPRLVGETPPDSALQGHTHLAPPLEDPPYLQTHLEHACLH